MIEKHRATNYARALSKYALKNNLLDKIEKDLISVKEVIWNNLSVRSYFIYPALQQDEKESFLTKICLALDLDRAIKNIISLLIEKDLFSLLPILIDKYVVLSQEEKKQGYVLAKTAYPLTATEKESILSITRAILKRDVILEEKNAPDLLAGLQILCVSQGIKIECSLKAKLDKLREDLIR